jgi:hypothetical protein
MGEFSFELFFKQIARGLARKLIFFVYPDPRGCEENQFTPLGAGVNKLILTSSSSSTPFRRFDWAILSTHVLS